MPRRKSAKQKVFRYLMGLHFGICYGPVDRVLRFLAGDREAWAGSVEANGTVAVNAPDLFGGNASEGGIVGNLTVMMGGPAQTLPGNVAAALPAQAPAFRGALSLFYDGLISVNNPYVKPMAFQVERIKAGWAGAGCWYEEKASIPLGVGASIAESIWWRLEGTAGLTLQESSVTLTGDGTKTYTLTLNIAGNVERRAYNAGVVVLDPASPSIITASSSAAPASPVHNIYSLIVSDPPATYYLNYRPPAEWTVGAFALTGSLTINVASNATITARADPVDALQDPPTPQYLDVDVEGAGEVFNGMNPAHIIYQCLTDPQWGMGYPTAAIDDANFTAAADTLYAEGLGLCMLWNTSDEIGAFVGKVLDHAGGVLYTDPQTGKFKLTLLRADYDPAALPVYDESNIVALESFQRVGYGDTVNEIVVVYRDVVTNKDASVTVQNLANIQAQGAVVSQTRQYPGLPNEQLALRVAQRDLDASSIPLAKARIKVNRKGWDRTPGGCIKLTWPKLGLAGVVMRVLDIDGGTLEDGAITINCAEDVFGLPASTYAEQEPPGWVPPDTEPQPIVRQAMMEAPYYLLAHNLPDADLAALDADASYFGALAVRPTTLSLGFAIHSRGGADAYAQTGSGLFVAGAELAGSLDQEASSTIALANPADLDSVSAGMFAVVGEGRAAEIMQVLTVDTGTNTITVDRGVLDTTPQEFAAGARVFFITGDETSSDTTERATAESIDYKLLPQTTGAQLEANLATPMTVTADQRQARPLAPGNLQINGVMFPSSVTGAINVTWAHRDRLQQTEGIVLQTDGSVGPEAGTTYTARLFDDETDALLAQSPALTDPAWSAVVLGAGLRRLEVTSMRDGLESWQRNVRLFFHGDGALLAEAGDLLLTEAGAIVMLDSPGLSSMPVWLFDPQFVCEAAGKLLVSTSEAFLDGGAGPLFLLSDDGGASYTKIAVADPNDVPGQAGSERGDTEVLSTGAGLSVYLNAYARASAQQTWSIPDLPDGTVVKGAGGLDDWVTQAWPRTAAGTPIGVRDMASDGSHFWALGSYIYEVSSGVDRHVSFKRVFKATAYAAFTEVGLLVADPSDPNALPTGLAGSWMHVVESGVGALSRVAGRWWLVGAAAYVTDDANACTGWLRAPLGLGEDAEYYGSGVALEGPIAVGGSLLIVIPGAGGTRISVSTDNGDTWVPCAVDAIPWSAWGVGQVVFDDAFMLYGTALDALDGTAHYVVRGVEPFAPDDWETVPLVGIPLGNDINAVFATSTGVAITITTSAPVGWGRVSMLMHSTDGINFVPAIVGN